MNEATTPQKPYRGTIIVDANALQHLSPSVQNAEGLPPMASGLDVLRFLGAHGYRILIPEMVTIESRVLANGFDVQTLFDTGEKYSLPSQKEFLKDAANGHITNVQIVSHTGPEEVDSFCQLFHDALGGHTAEEIAQNRDLRYNIRKNIIDLDDELQRSRIQSTAPKGGKKNSHDLGDAAILSLLSTEINAGAAKPVVVLTNDYNLKKTAYKNHPNQLDGRNASELILSLYHSGLLARNGLELNDATFKPTIEKMLKASDRDDRNRSIPNPYSDEVLRSDCYRSLYELSEELTESHPITEPPSGAERFKKKFEAVGRIRTSDGQTELG